MKANSVSIICIILAALSHGVNAQTSSLLKKQVKVNGQTWSLVLTKNEKDSQSYKYMGKKFTQSGTTLKLSKSLSSGAGTNVGAKNSVPQKLMWREFYSFRGQVWSGDAYFDSQSKKVYLAIADGNKFWIEVVDWQQAAKNPPKVIEIVKISLGEPKSANDLPTPPQEMSSEPFWIDSIAVAKVKNDIDVTIKSDGTPRVWRYSIVKKSWTKLPQAQASKKKLTDPTTTDGQSEESQKADGIIFSKPSPGSHTEGEGLSVLRRQITAPLSEDLQAHLPESSKGANSTGSTSIEFQFDQWDPIKGWTNTPLWTYVIDGGTTSIPFDVYEADYNADRGTLVTVFKCDGVLRANIVKANEQKTRSGLDWGATELKLSPLDAKKFTSATIKGNVDDDSLKIVLNDAEETSSLSFKFRDGKWVQTDGK